MKQQATRLVLAGALALLGMAFPSCKKGCYECVKGSSKSYICRDEFPTQKAFTESLKSAKTWGYKCKHQ
jgi:hypothetical protein